MATNESQCFEALAGRNYFQSFMELKVEDAKVGDAKVEKVLKLWSCNSVSGGRYVHMEKKLENGVHVVNASGEVEEALTNIHFIELSDRVLPPMYNLAFKYEDDSTYYYLQATETDVTASKYNIQGLPFHVMQLWYPNSEYAVLRSSGKANGKFLYLSSDTYGKMKLKASGDVHTPEIEPALLFRVVKPQ